MQRIQTKRITRDTIIIITNGKETEKNYFKNITSVFSSMYKISIKFCNKQCDKMVEYAISLKQPLINQIWCVFDIDDSFTEGHLIKAIELAKSNDINLAYSNESFEV